MKELLHFKIIVPVYNSEKWVGKCIDSIKAQSYRNFQCIIIDDNSKDKTNQQAKLAIGQDERFVLIRNKVQKFAMENRVNGIKISQPSDEDIIVDVDGDDWLYNEQVLDKVSKVYEDTKCLVTYGNFVYHPHGQLGHCTKCPKKIIDNNAFREDTWRYSHLRTYKFGLFKKIQDKEFKNSKGKYYKAACDLAIMFPLLEMAAHRQHFISDTLYVYNRENPINDDKVKGHLQRQSDSEIRQKKKYNKVEYDKEWSSPGRKRENI
jgi:glycosyltransferase involved in cell wall biosynthesis